MTGQKIVKSYRYKYLGISLDKNLNLLSQFEKMYQKVFSRMKLLARVCMNISPTTAETIYKVCNDFANNLTLQQHKHWNFRLIQI